MAGPDQQQQKPAAPKAPAPSDVNRYSVTGDKTRDWKTYNSFSGWGTGAGNRTDDTLQPSNPHDPNSAKSVKNATTALPKVAQPDLSVLVPEEQKQQQGVYRESSGGFKSKVSPWAWNPKGTYDTDKMAEGKAPVVNFGSASATWGATEKVGVRGQVGVDNQDHTALAKGDAWAKAEFGADGKATVGTDGAYLSGNVGGNAGVGVSGDADLAKKWNVAGVDNPVTAGVGVHGDAWAGVRAGAGARAGIGPDFTGVEGKIGGMAGVEANADVHGNLGPLAGKLGVSGYAGAGFEASGGITFEGGKLKIGGKLSAALGYGAGVSGEVTIDFKQAAQMAVAGGKALYKAADADGDGKLSLKDGAQHISNLAMGGAGLLDKGVSGAINLLDGDHDGKFSVNDLKVRGGQILDGLGHAKDAVLEGGSALLQKGKKALDRDGDGKLGLGDITAGAGQLKDAAMGKVNDLVDWGKNQGKKIHNFLDADGDGKIETSDIGKHLGNAGHAIVDTGKKIGTQVLGGLGAAKDWAMDKAGKAGEWLHNKMDADGDGKLGFGDLKHMGNDVLNHGKELIKDVHGALDLDGDGRLGTGDLMAGAGKIGAVASLAKKKAVDTFNSAVAGGLATYEKAKGAVTAIGKKAHDAADLDGDGKLGWNDVKTGASKAADWAGDKMHQAGDALHNAADRDGDGKLGWNDVTTGAKQAGGWVADRAGDAKDAVVGAASSAWEGIKDAGSTLKSGLSSAADSVKGTWGKVTSFFGF